MVVATLSQPETLAQQLKKLGTDDVLVFGGWRITVAPGPDRPYWLAGFGQVYSITRGRRSAATIRQYVDGKSSWPKR